MIQRNGFLWCAHHIFLPYGPAVDLERTIVQWWQIPLRNFIAQPISRIEKLTDDTSFAYPSIAVNRFNDVLIGYSRFSSIQWISGNYSFRDYCDSPLTVRSDTVLKAGEANFLRADSQLRNRWGDYSSTVVDPANDTDFWTLQEYARAPGSRWGTWWGKIALPVPANDSFTNAFAISNSSGTTNGTVIRATMETGEPLHGSGTNTPSVWYRWVAPASGDVTFDTTGGSSSFPLILSVYTGTNVSNLTLKTNASGSAPAVSFSASSGTTYQVAVSGLNVACIGFTLHWEQAAAPMFVQHPEGTNVVVGEDALFKSLAIPTLAYFWKFRGTNASDPTNSIAGANSATYTLSNVAGTNAGSYWVVASNATGFATSSVASLFVHGNSAARLSLLSYTSNSFYFHLYGLTNRAYRIETSTNLASPTNWYPIHTNYVSYWYTNYGLTNPNSRFFRAITNE
ncbi:MAG TPA: pre-peptidase C-terminal domain-containing protein [Verrucomicrobiae bacterium]|nr:pre-peptidase C-terminal domain-containing protein [Verrucomicrobiae bacterium]